jgi:hypothetical protein
VINATSVTVEGRAPSRRKSLCGIPHNDFYADLAIMPTAGGVGGGRGWSGGVSAGETVGIITGLGGRRGGPRVAGSGPRSPRSRWRGAGVPRSRPADAGRPAVGPRSMACAGSPCPAHASGGRTLRCWPRPAHQGRCPPARVSGSDPSAAAGACGPPRLSNHARTDSHENLVRARPATRSGCWFVTSTCLSPLSQIGQEKHRPQHRDYADRLTG